MEIYLDDCCDSDQLIAFLHRAGYVVHTPRTEGTVGAADAEHLALAAAQGWPILTKNPRDFRRLHDSYMAAEKGHAGILLLFQDNIRGKDMGPADIVRALGNLAAAGSEIASQLYVLNHWR